MSHEITESDSVVLHKTKAWHGMGVVVQDAPTPREALTIAGLDWGVEQLPIQAIAADGAILDVDTHVLNRRADTGEVLGLVGSDYQVVSNAELADFAEALAEGGDEVRFWAAWRRGDSRRRFRQGARAA